MPDEVISQEEVTKTNAALAMFWNKEILASSKREREWREEGIEVVKRYLSEGAKGKTGQKSEGLNILWSNVELLKPSVLSRTPLPDVRRRYLQEDPIAHAAAQLIEKALKFTATDPEYRFEETLEKARDDLLLPGRGVVRVIYENDTDREFLQEVLDPETQEPRFRNVDGEEAEPDGFDDDGFAFREFVSRQDLYCRYVYWEDYREGDARTWEDVPWVAYRHRFTRKQLKERFGPVAMLVPLNAGGKRPSGSMEADKNQPETTIKKATVWEIWNKEKREIVWIAEDFNDDVLEIEQDPLELENFYAQPEPLYAVKSTLNRVPVPEFRQYRAQAEELDELTRRIRRLIKALKVRGLYAAVVKEMSNLLDGEENELFPVEDWPVLADIGGMDGAVSWFPIDMIAKVLAGLYQQRNLLKQEIFEITGISDILRGSTDPRETLGAQEIKANFGTVRLSPRQKPMERFVRDIFEIEGEIIAEHFTADHLLEMTGMQKMFEEQPAEVQPIIPDQSQPSVGLQSSPGVIPNPPNGQGLEELTQGLEGSVNLGIQGSVTKTQTIQPQPTPQPKKEPVTMDQVMAMLRNDNTRKFNIDIETNSTIAVDEQEEQANVTEFLNASVQFITAAGNAAQTAPTMVPLFLEMYKSAARRFKMGRELEDVIEESMSSTLMTLQQAQAAPEQQVDPEFKKVKADIEQENAKFRAEQERLNTKLQAEIERLNTKMQAELAIKARSQDGELTLAEQEMVREQARKSIEAGIA